MPEPPTLAIVRRILFGILVLGLAGTEVELLLLKHTDGIWQLVPVLLVGASLLAVAWVGLSQGPGSLQVFRAMMLIFVLSGLAGLLLHFRGNLAFERESDPSLAGAALWHRAVMGATPTLAPGTMIQLGLVGLAFLFRHPRLSGRAGGS